jgi:hypothetical protein
MIKKYTWIFLTLLAVYVVLVFSLPPDPAVLAKYNFTLTHARILNVTIVVPVLLIYLTALYGFVSFYNYCHKVKDSREGPYLRQITNGLMVLAFSLPINSITGSINSYIRHASPSWSTESTVLRNYLSLVLAFASIYLIAQGIQGLNDTLKKKRQSSNLGRSFNFLGPIALASFYTWLITVQTRGVNTLDAYHMPDWLILLTIVIPYTYAWSIGIRAVLQLYGYQTWVKGSIYKKALRDVSLGVGVIVVSSIFVQLLVTMSAQLNRLNLTPLLMLIYVLLIIYALGYGLVARGARKLKMIEEA